MLLGPFTSILAVLGSVLSTQPAPLQVSSDPNRRLALDAPAVPVLNSLRWPGRPELPGGNAAWTYMIEHPFGSFALFVGDVPRRNDEDRDSGRGAQQQPFEVWVNGAEQPRGLGALAKTLSMDMRANDAAWLQLKLDALATVAEERPFEMPFPPHGEPKRMPGISSMKRPAMKATIGRREPCSLTHWDSSTSIRPPGSV